MFKKLKQKISEEEQKLQHALASTQVLWLPPSPSSDTSGHRLRGREEGRLFRDP